MKEERHLMVGQRRLPVFGIQDIPHAEVLQAAMLRERDEATAILAGTLGLQFDSEPAREIQALTSMDPAPSHADMRRVPVYLRRVRKRLAFVDFYAKRRN